MILTQGTAPRMDPEDMHGLVSDVCLKRKVRNYVQTAKENKSPYSIFVEHHGVLNETISLSHDKAREENPKEYGTVKAKTTREQVEIAKKWMCRHFYDVRTFGAVMSTGKDAGQVRGPVQLTFSRSLDPILPMDVPITRMAVTDPKEAAKAAEQDEQAAKSEPPNQTMGRKNLIPYGLYACQGFISANLAQQTVFTEDDLSLFWEAMAHMFDDDRSASRGFMEVRRFIAFKHVGTDSNAEQRARQAKLGCAPAHKLIELGQVLEISKKNGTAVPRGIEDYKIDIHRDRIPAGVELIELV